MNSGLSLREIIRQMGIQSVIASVLVFLLAVAATCRSSDVVMRLGGDEFVAFAPGVVTKDVGVQIIDRLFENIVETEIPELGGRRIFVSVGAAFCPKGTVMSFADLYKMADTCVYESKKREGNACTFADSET